jgi:hypothetical protein
MNHAHAQAFAAGPDFPLHLAVPLPCDPPRRPSPPASERRRRIRPDGERAVRCPGWLVREGSLVDELPVMEPGTC